jgi:hypothetical protein
MPKNRPTHIKEKVRRESSLGRLEKQLAALKANDEKALFLKNGDTASPERFKAKIKYVTEQIAILRERIR